MLKKVPLPKILSLIVLLTSGIFFSQAQMPVRSSASVTVTGWKDDSHYIVRRTDQGKNVIYQSVDVKSGKAVTVPATESPRDLLSKSLPSGTSLTTTDAVSDDNKSIVFFRENDLHYYRIGDAGLRKLTNDDAAEVNARFSPDGTKIAYTKNRDLYVFDLASNREIRFTTDASDRIYNGYASWVYMEEILGRSSNYAAFWWSPDGSKLAFLRTDETDVPVFTLNRLDEPDGIHGKLEVTPYPKPGDPNPKVKMGIADVPSGKTIWVKTDYSVDQYLAWPFWTPDSRSLAIQVLNRDQNDLRIILADVSTGDFRQILQEKNNTWVDFHEDIEVLDNGSGFIVRSSMTGFENLYHYSWSGELAARVTNLDFRVTSVERIDEKNGLVYFYAAGPESTDRHFFRAGLDGKNLLQVTKGEGTHSVTVSPKGTYLIDSWNSVKDPGIIAAYDKKGNLIREIHRQPAGADAAKTELFRIKSADGLFDLPALIIYPDGFDPGKKYPVVFSIYGGPDSKNISNSWQGSGSWFARNGIIEFKVDHRGSGHFGKPGLDYMHRNLGKWEIADYSDGVKWLRSKPWADAGRIGIRGSSYGGYMSCLALTKGAEFWTHGYAGSPVSDWRLYDNVYTERFMDTPADNPEGYKTSSVLNYVADYKGKLFITHGDMDDNVHMQNLLYLVSKLQDAGKRFGMMIYPGNRHGIRGMKGMHNRNEENNFWMENFFGIVK